MTSSDPESKQSPREAKNSGVKACANGELDVGLVQKQMREKIRADCVAISAVSASRGCGDVYGRGGGSY